MPGDHHCIIIMYMRLLIMKQSAIRAVSIATRNHPYVLQWYAHSPRQRARTFEVSPTAVDLLEYYQNMLSTAPRRGRPQDSQATACCADLVPGTSHDGSERPLSRLATRHSHAHRHCAGAAARSLSQSLPRPALPACLPAIQLPHTHPSKHNHNTVLLSSCSGHCASPRLGSTTSS